LSLTTSFLTWALGASEAGVQFGAGLAATLLGIAAATWDGLNKASPGLLAGDLCLLLASLSWSGYGIYVRQLRLPPVMRLQS
jgi:drug/metabolite transporter (DMT)-like permease